MFNICKRIKKFNLYSSKIKLRKQNIVTINNSKLIISLTEILYASGYMGIHLKCKRSTYQWTPQTKK